MKVWRIAIITLLASLAWATEGWHRPFAVMGPDQGVPNGGITCMAQDVDGFIWLGTESGLLRYEGGQCSRWTRKDGLPSDYVSRLMAIPDGGLWISTAQGLVRYQRGRLEPARFDAENTVKEIRALSIDDSGRLWVATNRGLFLQAQNLDFRLHPHAPPGQISTLVSGRSGAMHAGSDHGLSTFQPDGSVETWNATHGLPPAGVALAGEDGEGRLWACTGRVLVMKAPGAGRFTDRSSLLKAGITPNGVFYKDADGALWLPTLVGGLRLRDANPDLLDATAGLPMRWVRGVFRDREGGLWILGPTLARLQGDDQVWNHPITSGPSGISVWCMLRDRHRGLLVGTDNGVVRMNGAEVRQIPGTEGHRVKAMSFDHSGVLWMVGTTGPVLWLAPGEAKARIAPLGEPGQGLHTVMTDASGGIWAGHPRLGLLRWDAAGRRLVRELGPEGTPATGLTVFRIREDAVGRLWAATSLGLYVRERIGVWHLFTEKDGILSMGLYGMAFLPDGTAWIHSREPQGLMRVRVEGDRVTVLERRRLGQGLHSDLIYAVEVDPRGFTWASTDQGFDCLDTRLHVGRREGVISEDCDVQALLAEAGSIWVGTSAGLVRYDIREGKPGSGTPLPHILQVMKGEQRFEAPFGTIGPVGPGDSSLAFRVAVPSYRHEGQLRVQVRLLGLGESWRDLDAPLTRYPALPGGRYRFEVRAAQPDGDFGAVAGFSFEVSPPWWRTWWAYLLWGACVVGLILLIIRLRVASLAQSKLALEDLVTRRTDELRNRNLELTDALGRVKQLSGLLPICACCKKIRDDRGYWNQLEQYISSHSEVGFSHGICPDCAETMYPGHLAKRPAKKPEVG